MAEIGALFSLIFGDIMQIGDSYDIADPSRISRNLSVIEAVNETLQYVISYKPFGTVSYIPSVRLTWDAVSEEELGVLRTAFDLLTENYAYVYVPFLGGDVEGHADAMMATLSPQSTPKIQMNQESVAGTAYDLRSYTVEVDLVGYPSVFSV